MRALRHARLFVQLLLFAIASAIVAHGLAGPQLAPRNLATVLTWVHYRGLLIVALLAAANVFCFGCPMILVRDLGRKLAHPALRWPRALRTKWVAVALFVAVLFAYELFDLWERPSATAWLVLLYFAAALVVDVLFAGASFCKYLCPIGQFNFVASTMSPAELKVRDLATCRTCATVDCIRGTRAPRPDAVASATPRPLVVVRRGCELALFQPLKIGNLDCTLCLDCVHACPHDNVAMAWRVPGEELLDTRRRSGIGTLAGRRDLAALAVVFTFGALLNAFAMTRPVYATERWIAGALHTTSEWPVMLVLFALAFVVIPGLLVGGAAAVARALAGAQAAASESLPATAVRYAYALIPFGVGLWAAHYGFHLLTGALTVIPVTQSAAVDLTGQQLLGAPMWRLAGMQPGSVFPIQLGLLLLGAIGSLAIVLRMSAREQRDRLTIAAVPWAALVVLLAATAVWILAQPMELRGLGSLG